MEPFTNLAHMIRPRGPFHWLRLGLKAEFGLFRRPFFVLSALAIVFVPSLYAVFYISSFWDPYSHLDRLPAALVNADRGTVRGGRTINLGEAVVKTFEEKPPFRFIRMQAAKEAEDAVRHGEVYLSLIIPADFSEQALAARQNRPATLTLEVAEGANYTGAIISKRFAGELAHTLNERINRERWAAIIGEHSSASSPSVIDAVGRLRDGGQKVATGAKRLKEGSIMLNIELAKATDGAKRLSDGTKQFADASVALSDGMRRISAGAKEMRNKLPPPDKLQELAKGSTAAVDGGDKLASGLDQLVVGGQRLRKGARQLHEGAGSVPFGGSQLSDGAAQLEAGIVKLDAGLTLAASGSHDLSAGLKNLDSGIQPLSAGIIRLEQGLQTMIDQLPSSEQCDQVSAAAVILTDGTASLSGGLVQLRSGSHQLVDGSEKLKDSTAQMAAGLERLYAGLSEGLADADARGLSAPVRLSIESTAPVPNNGTAFSPYFAPLSLWVGGIMMTFILYFRRIIDPLRESPRWVRWLVKAAVPLLLGILQATVVVGVLRVAFGIMFAHPWFVWIAACLGSLAFVSVILLLLMVLADAGRLFAVVFLILQLAAAGGIYPVELSGKFYETIHPYLPFSALVTAFRATMFTAYGGEWLGAAVQLVATALISALLAIWLARWKYVSTDSYGPAVDFP